MWNVFLQSIGQGDKKSLSRAISLVENEAAGYEEFLRSLPINDTIKITGITGPAGSGKSTILDGLIGEYIRKGLKTAVICVDPTSAFSGGAILGDRIRMREWYNHPDVYIRSMATRGSWGGLNPGIVEVTDLMKAAHFDQIIIETVGVGQTEIEIADFADTTVVVQVPEGGDDIQAMKSGLMEVADIFAVNKCDRPGADEFIKNLRGIASDQKKEVPIVRLTASRKEGIGALVEAIGRHQQQMDSAPAGRLPFIMKKAYQLILKKKMRTINKKELEAAIEKNYGKKGFNLYEVLENIDGAF